MDEVKVAEGQVGARDVEAERAEREVLELFVEVDVEARRGRRRR